MNWTPGSVTAPCTWTKRAPHLLAFQTDRGRITRPKDVLLLLASGLSARGCACIGNRGNPRNDRPNRRRCSAIGGRRLPGARRRSDRSAYQSNQVWCQVADKECFRFYLNSVLRDLAS